LADVYALTAYCESYINTVIDEEGNAVSFAFFVELLCYIDKVASV
jgi:hypothetical protein